MKDDELGPGYRNRIANFPMLSFSEEQFLAKRWRFRRDRAALERLINSHLRLVIKIATSYRGYKLPFVDLVSEGNVGLIKAARKFDPSMGFRLSTYAMWWIRAAIQEYILRNWSLVKMGTTAAQKRLFYKLHRTKARIRATDDNVLRADQIQIVARSLGVQEREVAEMDQRLLARDHSLNIAVDPQSETELIDWLADPQPTQDENYERNKILGLHLDVLSRAIAQLEGREREILIKRRLMDEPLTLARLSEAFGISKQRISQIEMRAFRKIQKSVRELTEAL